MKQYDYIFKMIEHREYKGTIADLAKLNAAYFLLDLNGVYFDKYYDYSVETNLADGKKYIISQNLIRDLKNKQGEAFSPVLDMNRIDILKSKINAICCFLEDNTDFDVVSYAQNEYIYNSCLRITKAALKDAYKDIFEEEPKDFMFEADNQDNNISK